MNMTLIILCMLYVVISDITIWARKNISIEDILGLCFNFFYNIPNFNSPLSRLIIYGITLFDSVQIGFCWNW